MVKALINELELRRNYFTDQVSTIYFGGGTPSLLEHQEIDRILEAVYKLFHIENQAEVTLEANPEDVTPDALINWGKSGINRLSIGIQSFDDELLRFMNRAHDGKGARIALEKISEQFENYTLDLIYGIPGSEKGRLNSDLTEALSYNPAHISAYALTIEPKTVFGNWKAKNKLTPVKDDEVADEFIEIHNALTSQGFDHYEVSNYARQGYKSLHNTGYWQERSYLGIGPSAHSYNLNSRQFNVANNIKYIKSIGKGIVPAVVEVLDREAMVNDYILTSLRTKWGISKEKLMKWDYDLDQKSDFIRDLVQNKYASMDNGILKLTPKGFLLADQFAQELFL